MSQNSLILPTTGTLSGLQAITDTNNALDTLNTLASGAAAPSTIEAGQLWHDTANNLIKIRNLANTAWITLGALDETNNLFYPTARPLDLSGRLQYVSATSISYVPYNGSTFQVAGAQLQLPASGIIGGVSSVLVNGASGSLAASTDYYVSVYNNGGSPTMAYWQRPTYGHMSDTTSGNVGIEVIESSSTPNSAHTLVGLVSMNGSAQFVDSATNRQVRSWYNRKKEYLQTATASETYGGTSPGEVSTSYRIYATMFSDDAFDVRFNGEWSNAGSNSSNANINFNGGTSEIPYLAMSQGASPTEVPFALSMVKTGSPLIEGLNYATLFGTVNTTTYFNISANGTIS